MQNHIHSNPKIKSHYKIIVDLLNSSKLIYKKNLHPYNFTIEVFFKFSFSNFPWQKERLANENRMHFLPYYIYNSISIKLNILPPNCIGSLLLGCLSTMKSHPYFRKDKKWNRQNTTNSYDWNMELAN